MSVRRSVLAGAAGKVAGKAAGKVARKAAKKKVATKNTAATKAAEEFASGKGEAAASGNNDAAAKRVVVKSYTRARTPRKRSAVERLNDRPPPMADPLPPPSSPGLELIARVSRAIERELMQIERIVGGHRVPIAQRSEAERRARTLASLARTLNEVKRLRAEEEKPKAADDDAVPRDLDEFRRELSRRLALMDAAAAPLPAGGDE